MRVLYQPATDPPGDWLEVDVTRDRDWRLVIPANLVALNVQGVILEGHGHYAVEATPGGVRAYQWTDDATDPRFLFAFGSVWDFATTDFDPALLDRAGDTSIVRGTTADDLAIRLARDSYRVQAPDVVADWTAFGADERAAIMARAHEVNTRQSVIHYVAPEGLATFGLDRFATPAEVAAGTGNVLPFADFPTPHARQTAHGFDVPDIAAYDAARTPRGWREWVG